jgi:hypothetical protein
MKILFNEGAKNYKCKQEVIYMKHRNIIANLMTETQEVFLYTSNIKYLCPAWVYVMIHKICIMNQTI